MYGPLGPGAGRLNAKLLPVGVYTPLTGWLSVAPSSANVSTAPAASEAPPTPLNSSTAWPCGSTSTALSSSGVNANKPLSRTRTRVTIPLRPDTSIVVG